MKKRKKSWVARTGIPNLSKGIAEDLPREKDKQSPVLGSITAKFFTQHTVAAPTTMV